MAFDSSPIIPVTYPLMAELSIDLFTVPCSCKAKTSTLSVIGILFIKSSSAKRTPGS